MNDHTRPAWIQGCRSGWWALAFAMAAALDITAEPPPARTRSEESPGAAIKQRLPDGLPPTLREVRYGPHERNVLNFWRASSEVPTPLVFRIHGGGWLRGDMTPTESPQGWLDRGISVVSIRYRLTGTDILPAPVHDAARALQFVRYHAKEWNIDARRIVCIGGSAGACSALWLALHDDLADRGSADPVARQSTKPAGAAVSNAQTTLDPAWIARHIGPAANLHPMIFRSFGASSAEEMLANPAHYSAAIREFSPLEHVDRNDPPIYLQTGNDLTVPAKNASHGIHHPIFSLKLKEAADAVGLRCHVVLRGEGESTVSIWEFVEELFRPGGVPTVLLHESEGARRAEALKD